MTGAYAVRRLLFFSRNRETRARQFIAGATVQGPFFPAAKSLVGDFCLPCHKMATQPPGLSGGEVKGKRSLPVNSAAS